MHNIIKKLLSIKTKRLKGDWRVGGNSLNRGGFENETYISFLDHEHVGKSEGNLSIKKTNERTKKKIYNKITFKLL